jgi:hypothetical protein
VRATATALQPRLAHANIAAGPSDVLDIELLPERFAEFLSGNPREDIGASAGREWHNLCIRQTLTFPAICRAIRRTLPGPMTGNAAAKVCDQPSAAHPQMVLAVMNTCSRPHQRAACRHQASGAGRLHALDQRARNVTGAMLAPQRD